MPSLLAEVLPISVERAAKQLEKLEQGTEVIIIDLRTPAEFKKGHLKGARNLDFKAADFTEKLEQLDRKKTYLMHCRSGGRSAASIPVWNRLGFQSVLHMSSGTLGWTKAGKPLVKMKAVKSPN